MRLNLIVIFALLFVACGAPPPASDQAQATAIAKIDAGLNPGVTEPIATIIPETPTLPPTAAELEQLKGVATRLTMMHRAADKLDDPETIAGSDWRSKVHSQVTTLLSSRNGIKNIGLPERYQTPRLTEILNGCAMMAERLNRVDVSRSDLVGIEGLERCVNGLREMAFVYTEYAK